ncbi:hypothetical protein BC629DRAFT_1550051 [Irpex lacteus]|nr:hypothetical protein BC629DRAFT_1550051 [Irpex lacteus]
MIHMIWHAYKCRISSWRELQLILLQRAYYQCECMRINCACTYSCLPDVLNQSKVAPFCLSDSGAYICMCIPHTQYRQVRV